MRVNVSARLTSYAMKVVRNGCVELVEVVGKGKLAVSTAAAVAGLPRARRLVEAGPKEALRSVRELRAPATPPLGRFGVVAACGVCERGKENAGGEGITLLWVATSGLEDAIAALKGKGFRYAPGEG